jgi:MFS family permease
MSVIVIIISQCSLVLTSTDFGNTSSIVKGKVVWNVTGSLLGIISASYNLGAILAVPIVPWVAQKVGRRWSIFIGSCFQCVGAVIQCFSQNCELLYL